MANKLVSSIQFAKIKGVSPRAVRKAITEGRVQAEMINGKWFLNQDEGISEWEGNTQRAVKVSLDFDGAVEQQEEIHPDRGTRVCTLAEAKTLKEYFSGYEIRLKCQKMAEELIPIVDAKHEINLTLTRFRSSLQTLPQAFMSGTAHLVGTDVAIKQSKILEELLKKTLTNICDVEIKGDANESV